MSDAEKGARDELDPELAEWLDEARDIDERTPEADYAAMLGAVEEKIAAADAKPSFWLKSRATWVRRLIAVGAALSIVLLGGIVTSKRDLGALSPLHLALALGALSVLLGASLHQALRPLHRPPIARWARACITALTLGATFVLALLPVPDAAGLAYDGLHVSPCLFYGLFMGVPVYLVLRLLDRSRGASSPLLAACAAGLAGNLVLELHCPRSNPEHLMLSHFTVALIFVAGLGLVHVLLRARER